MAIPASLFAQEPPPDSDGDGFPDTADVCPADADPEQRNFDPITFGFGGEQLVKMFCPNNRLGGTSCPSNSPIYTGRGPFAVAVANFDARSAMDRGLDVAVATRVDGRIWVHFNNGNLQNGVKINRRAAIFRGTMGVEDLNGNGVLDGVCPSGVPCASDFDCRECEDCSQCPVVQGSCDLVEDLDHDNAFDTDDRENLGCIDADPRTPCQVTFLSTPGDLRGIVASDFNNDGNPDIAAVSFISSQVLVFAGRGDGTFNPPSAIASGAEPRDLISADFNKDGLEDLAIPRFSGNAVTVLLGKPDGSFQGAPSVPAGPGVISVAAGDLDLNGTVDLAILNFGSIGEFDTQNVTIALGSGTGTFSVQPGRATATLQPFHIVIGAASADPYPDILTVSPNEHRAELVLGRGDGTFESPGIGFATQGVGETSQPGPRFAAISDMTADRQRLPELVIANHTQGAMSLRVNGGTLPLTATSIDQDTGEGPGFFRSQTYSTLPEPASGGLVPPNGPRGFVVVDMDSSGTADLVAANLDAGTLNILTSAGDPLGDACDNCPNTGNQNQCNHDRLDTDHQTPCVEDDALPAAALSVPDELGDACDLDDDGDGVPDPDETLECNDAIVSAEQCIARRCLDPLHPDSDADGVADGRELLFYGTHPWQADFDGDGSLDGADDCPLDGGISGRGLVQSDGDGIADICDLDDDDDGVPDDAEALAPPLGTGGTDPLIADSDGDGDGATLLDGADNCPLHGNADQRDTDTDRDGDACDADDDNDGLTDSEELSGTSPTCPGLLPTDPLKADSDGDGHTDFEERRISCTDPNDSADPDSDGDGLPDFGDNCPEEANSQSEDANGNGTLDPGACLGSGRVCRLDVDCGGGKSSCQGSEDYNRNGVLDRQLDRDADGLGDACDPNIDGDALDNELEGSEFVGCFPGCDPFDPDTDGDGLLDGRELSPLLPDTDFDGVPDSRDNCPFTSNPDQLDEETAPGPDGLCADTAGGLDGNCATVADNNVELAGADQNCGTADDVLPFPEGPDRLCGTGDDNVALFGPDGACGASEGHDRQCGTKDDYAALFGADELCGTVDDLPSDDFQPSGAGRDELCAETAGGLDGRCATAGDNNPELFGIDGQCGTEDDVRASSRGIDGLCGNSDDNRALYGPNQTCGEADDLTAADDVNHDNNPELTGNDGRCGTTDDLHVGDGAGETVRRINADNNPLLVGTDGRCGTSDDARGDRLGDQCEGDFLTSTLRADTDGDGLLDGAEVNEIISLVRFEGMVFLVPLDPADSDRDSDNDGLCDGAEVAAGVTNPLELDTDFDEVPDGPAPRNLNGYDCLTYDPSLDILPGTVGDGIRDGDDPDNCPALFNPDQANLDRALGPPLSTPDNLGDVCDDDIDGDGLSNQEEVQKGLPPNDSDHDNDGSSDFEEVRVVGSDPFVPDTDFDRVSDGPDNCPLVSNPEQRNRDGDGQGDACDCAPFDGNLEGPPAESSGLSIQIQGNASLQTRRASLLWLPAPEASVVPIRYDLVRGRIADLRSSRSFAAAACRFLNLELNFSFDESDPAPGEVLYYGVRAKNSCAGGSYGSGSKGERRVITSCGDTFY